MDDARLAATVMLLRDGEGGCLEVLLLKRHLRSDVHGGVHVFPGGKVDDADAALARERFGDAHTLAPAFGDPLMTSASAATLHVAALRELEEECGICMPDGSPLVPCSRWITPLTTQVRKRFDTWFFVGRMPAGAVAQHDDHEAVESRWWRPREALESYRRGTILLAPPQIMSLVGLARHRSAESVLRHARAVRPGRIQPEHVEDGADRVLVFPGDSLHSVAERAMPGPSRLLMRDGRFELPEGDGLSLQDD